LLNPRRDLANCRGRTHDSSIKSPQRFGLYLRAQPANLLCKPANWLGSPLLG